uniref:Uncharacterized protein n=1 Tax=Arundo donax TaxID=35708 RepID=A0A0A9PMX2_ARUDO
MAPCVTLWLHPSTTPPKYEDKLLWLQAFRVAMKQEVVRHQAIHEATGINSPSSAKIHGGGYCHRKFTKSQADMQL